MQTVAFKMKLRPGCKEEYRRRHAALWPEMRELLHRNGIRNYTIYFDEATGSLFAVQDQEGKSSSQDLGSLPIVQKWWAHMADIMETNPDHSPVSTPLEPLFHLD
ncbi:MAG: L-rhamnose mutarotase [Lentisphaeria bacterium]